MSRLRFEVGQRVLEDLGIAIERRCHCGQLAEYLATDAEGLQWFECGRHEPRENIGETTRVSLVPLHEWLAEIRKVGSK